MKKIIWLLSLVVLIGGIITSCSSDDNNKQVDEGTEVITKSAKGIYEEINSKGDFKIVIKTDDSDLNLNFISDVVPGKNLLDPELKAGKYNVVGTKALYTITTDSYISKADVQTKLTSGELNVAKSGDVYTIKGSLTDANGNKLAINYNGAIDIQPIYETTYEVQNGWYWGDNKEEFPNIGEYMTYFTQGEANRYGELEGDGHHISISIYDLMPAKAWEAKIPNKTYVPSTEYKLGTFNIATKAERDANVKNSSFGKYLYNNKQKGIKQDQYITGGSIKVMANDNDQELRFNIELQDGSRHLGKYIGKVKQTDAFTVSTLRADKNVTNLTVGYIEYQGKSPVAGKTNNRWDIYLFEAGVTPYPEYYWATEGTGEFMRITVYTELDQKTFVPNGVYKIANEAAGNAEEGHGNEPGLDFGTWFYQLQNDDFKNYAPLKTGNVTINKTGDQYNIKLNGIDDRQNKITVDYTGALLPIDASNENALAKKRTATKKINKDYGNGKTFDLAKKARLTK